MTKLLIIDNDYSERQTLIQRLSKINSTISLVEAASITEALNLIQQDCFDIIMTELTFPLSSGETFIKSYRQLNSKTPIVIVSHEQNFKQLQSLIPYHISYYLVKPLKNEELIRCIQHLPIAQVKQNNGYSEVINTVINLIQTDFHKDLNLDSLAAKVYLSPNYLSSLFKKEVGKTLSNYITEHRLIVASEFLVNSTMKITTISKIIGIENSSYFNKLFKNFFHLTPSEYRRSQKKNKSL
ncbi:helix-turn-helix domain-containing protein [Vagococcus fessus]|uniref:DNA-binding response regulator n=1 Tax=Vagococcus fessus TaxID=120370 RepID=A0A430A594_9ENTE|nr:helix-turn-helix domain-containing protein [Vagococcus fessus]RSU01983.1 hypothetical protein CBF31_09475 [Vagococcus fessus]